MLSKVLITAKCVMCVFLVCVLLVGVIALPVFAKSSSWNFEMNYKCRVVDGAKNKKFHSLDKGKAKISGKVWPGKVCPGATIPRTLYFELHNKTSGNKFGTVSVTPYAKKDKSKSFSCTYSKSVGGGTKYYLYIFRAEADGRTIQGTGTLANK